MLIVFGGLPGTGKTTIAKLLAARRSAALVRIDEIEQALRSNTRLGPELGAEGYLVAYAIAGSNLRIGNWVIADSVNPVAETRQAWRGVAREAGRPILEIEVICSDAEEHRHRVESRRSDIAGMALPSWASVRAREYTPWTEPRLVLDTARLSAADSVGEIEANLEAIQVASSRI